MTAPEFLRDWSYAAAGRAPMWPADALAKAWDQGYMDALVDIARAGHAAALTDAARAGMRPNPYRMPDEGDYDDG